MAEPYTYDVPAIAAVDRLIRWHEKRAAADGRLALSLEAENLPIAAETNRQRAAAHGQTVERLRYQDDEPSWHPAMVAMVSGPDGKPATLHRTYLTEDGHKAAVEVPRRLMPGTIPEGAAIRLFDEGPVLGIAEGIETALAAASLFGVPTWAAVSSGMLARWIPPDTAREIVVFGDRDPKFGGQAAAYALAHRLALRGLKVRVEIPARFGADWNDVLLDASRAA